MDNKFIFILSLIATFLMITSNLYSSDINIYDSDGGYSFGNIDSDGNVDIYDSDGGYSFGTIDGDGSIEIYE